MATNIKGGAGDSMAHDSAHKHVSGEAIYIDDIPSPAGLLHGYIVMSTEAHAKILEIDPSEALDTPGVKGFFTAKDIIGHNDVAPIFSDEPVLAEEIVEYAGMPLAVIIADSFKAASLAGSKVKVRYQKLDSVLSIKEALKKESFVAPEHTLRLGDADHALANSTHTLEGSLSIGGQDHFYLEGQIAMAIPQEDDDLLVFSSTQHPSEVQALVAEFMDYDLHKVTVEVRRMGGGFGGKETQPAIMACCASLAATKLGKPVKIRLCRDDDMIMTGKRHNFEVEYKVGFDSAGVINGVKMQLASQCGNVADLSTSILDRALFHADNCYNLKNAILRGLPCKTNTVSNTAFRGFGGPQGMIAIEHIIDEISRYLKLDSLEVRRRNLYGKESDNVTPYHQVVEDNIVPEILDELERSSEYRKRRIEVDEFNTKNEFFKKGLAISPVKFGISFTTSFLNQAGALIHIYKDGSIHLNHGGTEMGQGLFTKVAQIVAHEFQVDLSKVKITATTTAKVPNTSATAASSGTDLNGKAAQAAAIQIRQRLVDFGANHFKVKPDTVKFVDSAVHFGETKVAFDELIDLAYHHRVSLSSTGFYATPKIFYDREKASGRPFFYYAYGACVSEVVIDVLSGEYRFLRADILHDVGHSINPAIDLGQVEGAFIQGLGWLTMEELWWNEQGHLKTHAPSTYKIPTCRDIPIDLRVQLMPEVSNREDTIYRSKAVGEPPFMLAISGWLAIKDAIAATSDQSASVPLNCPATPEHVLMTIQNLRS